MVPEFSFSLHLNSHDRQRFCHGLMQQLYLCILCHIVILVSNCYALPNRGHFNAPHLHAYNTPHIHNPPITNQHAVDSRRTMASSLTNSPFKASIKNATESFKAATAAFGVPSMLSVRPINTSLHPNAVVPGSEDSLSGGPLALEEARRAAGFQPPASSAKIGDMPHTTPGEPRTALSVTGNPKVQQIHPIDGALASTKRAAAQPIPNSGGPVSAAAPNDHAAAFPLHNHAEPYGQTHMREEAAPVNCDSVVCIELRDKFLDTVEDESCRAIFDNGKCPTLCSTSLSTITGNQSWPSCIQTCPDDDVVMSSVSRWIRLCDAHTESFIDQGKEAVKSFVSESLASRLHLRVVLQFFIGVLILVLGVGYGYRRGSLSAQMAHYARQKRRRAARKQSDTNLPM